MSSHGGGGTGGGGIGDASPAGGIGPASHWPQVCAQLLWNQGWSHLSVCFSHHVLGLMSWHGGGGGGGEGGDGGGEGGCGGEVFAQSYRKEGFALHRPALVV